MKTPGFIIVGAHKAGTTSLHYYLKQHPQIFLPARKGQDLLYRKRFSELSEAGEYLAQFEPAEAGQAIGEVSSVYLHRGKEFAEKIKYLFPEVKIIAVLRNPVERTFSHATWRDRPYTEEELLNFENIVLNTKEFLLPGMYYTHIQNYYSFFDREQVKIFLYEDFSQNTQKFFAELFSFIGVDPNFVPDISERHHVRPLRVANPYRDLLDKGHAINGPVKSLIPKWIREVLRKELSKKSHTPKPKMSDELRIRLTNYFGDEVTNLQQLTGLEVSHWLKMPESNQTTSKGVVEA